MKTLATLGLLTLAAASAGCSSAAPATPAAPVAIAPLPTATVHSVEAFLQTLPAAQTPPMSAIEAMTLAAFPLSCVDHPQGQPSGGPGGGGGAGASSPRSARGGAAPAGAPDTAAVSSPGAARGANSGGAAAAPAAPRPGGYLWLPAGPTHLLENYDKQRAFYGCYDWHSAVNSTWTLVTVLHRYPDLPIAKLIREKLNDHLGKRNIEGELAFFQGSKSFERPYGQAWLLKLYADLVAWKDPDAQKWAANLAPLAQFFSGNLTKYLKTMPDPIRQGVHPNTAFDMDLMLPYTDTLHDEALHAAIVETAHRFYAKDVDCPTAYEPEGASFLSPCLVEASLMAHVLDRGNFTNWFNQFMPAVYAPAFRPLISPFDASQMTPDEMAAQSHLIGLAFSRAKAMLTVADALAPNDPRVPVYRRLAAIHAKKGYSTMDDAGYLETHWIATYALMYEVAASSNPTPASAIASLQ
ncbi:MAG TPA: DUF2891 family protein [Terriglobales bacterium]|nr:DUF2891 family protein [Terriglobales bacterium]